MKFIGTIIRKSSKIMLLALYLGFFFVQLTANFDIQNNWSKLNDTSLDHLVSKQHTNFNYILGAAKTLTHQQNIRLNKRFFPEFSPLIAKFQFSINPISMEPIASCYASPCIQSVHLLAFSRRGPPVVA